MHSLNKSIKRTMRAIRGYALKGSGLILATTITAACYLGSTTSSLSVDIANCANQYNGLLTAEDREKFRRGSYFVNSNGNLVAAGMCAALDNKLVGYNQEAQAIYDMARYKSIGITEDMVEISKSLGVELQGLEHSVKTASSVISKIERKADKDVKNGIVPKKDFQYVADMGDLVRFTQVGKHDSMAANTLKTIAELKDRGYTIMEVDNKYLNKEGRYKAIHINAVSPDGQSFELQVHSDKSMEANNATHVLYEEWRNVSTSAERKAELFAEIKAIYDALPVPRGIENITGVLCA